MSGEIGKCARIGRSASNKPSGAMRLAGMASARSSKMMEACFARGKKPRTTRFFSSPTSTMCGPSSRKGSRFSARNRSAISWSNSLTGAFSAAGGTPVEGFTTLNRVSPWTEYPNRARSHSNRLAHWRKDSLEKMSKLGSRPWVRPLHPQEKNASTPEHSEKLFFTYFWRRKVPKKANSLRISTFVDYSYGTRLALYPPRCAPNCSRPAFQIVRD